MAEYLSIWKTVFLYERTGAKGNIRPWRISLLDVRQADNPNVFSLGISCVKKIHHSLLKGNQALRTVLLDIRHLANPLHPSQFNFFFIFVQFLGITGKNNSLALHPLWLAPLRLENASSATVDVVVADVLEKTGKVLLSPDTWHTKSYGSQQRTACLTLCRSRCILDTPKPKFAQKITVET